MHVGNTIRSPGGTIEASVLVYGVAQPLHRHPSGGRIFVVGWQGERFSLRVKNLTADRIKVICTVDGRDSFNDEPGDPYSDHGRIIEGHDQSTHWHLGGEQTSRFQFGAVEHGSPLKPSNVGAIGFAVWREQPGAHQDFPVPSTMLQPHGSVLDVFMGAPQAFDMERAGFKRAGTEPELLILGYDTEDALKERGLFEELEPDAFPGAKPTI
jgi:hypothetical protein